ncbi:MAG: sensor histidine kinase [Anaerolineales bacterium]|nr:sensor histidine kinase [Anaerolineales bacterium]
MALTDRNQNRENDNWESLKKDVQGEIQQAKQELQEINMMLEQSQLEVGRLAQKNASVTARLQQLHGHFESSPREDIRMIYDETLDAQQRLFVMRGQSEKLQSDQKHLDKYTNYLEKFLDAFSADLPPAQKKGSSSVFGTVESIIQAQETERQRLSRQMHDGPAQALSNFILQTEIAIRLFDIDQEKARQELIALKDSATSAFQQVRDFVFELRPMMLDDLGLVPTLKRYVEAFKEQTRSSIRLSVNGVERRLESYIEVIIFRAVQEILGYVVRQGQASQISVQMDITEAHIKVTIDDNGKSIDVDAIMQGAGMGIKVIKDRVEMLGGYLEIDSHPGKGNLIVFQVPAGTSGQSVFA